TARSLRSELTDSPWPVAWQADAPGFLRALRFRLIIHHELTSTTIEPDAIKNIGVPDDVPYDERIYRLNFTLPEVPVTDRLVLETHTSDGALVCKFHLELL